MNYESGYHGQGRNYRRERHRAQQDEWMDFENGADYIATRPFYRNTNEYWTNNFDEPGFGPGMYSPSYAYDSGSYDDNRLVGYGNENSLQARDFDRWHHEERRFRNRYNFRDAEPPHRDRNDRPFLNSRFSEGRYEYRDQYMQHPHHDDDDRRRNERDFEHWDRFHSRSGRHFEIVRPFKQQDEYGWNDLEHSVGFGNSEMVFHRDRRPDALDDYDN